MKGWLQGSASVNTDEIPAESFKPGLSADARSLPSANVLEAFEESPARQTDRARQSPNHSITSAR